ncbi:MAG: glycoside hydrolase family 25 protein [Acidobacteria bacterium]|nr:glycoside hydrolase family 25 protein [Acidobacteriota bacterium]
MSNGAQTNYLTGIDVSHYQGAVNWREVKGAGCAFAFAKATESTSIVDPEFAANWSGMKSVGLVRGAYHFFRPEQNAVEQANHFLQVVQLEPGDLPPVIDIELNDGVMGGALIAGVGNWIDTVAQATGMTPMIYTATYFWNEYMNDGFGKFPLWLAHYSSAPEPLPKGWANWTFWQYSQSLSIPGVSGAADHNRFDGAQSDLQALTKPAA